MYINIYLYMHAYAYVYAHIHKYSYIHIYTLKWYVYIIHNVIKFGKVQWFLILFRILHFLKVHPVFKTGCNFKISTIYTNLM